MNAVDPGQPCPEAIQSCKISCNPHCIIAPRRDNWTAAQIRNVLRRIVTATEKVVADIERNFNASAHQMDLHQLDDLLKQEYAASENEPGLRRRILDLIDKMLSLEIYGVENIIAPHER